MTAKAKNKKVTETSNKNRTAKMVEERIRKTKMKEEATKAFCGKG